MPKRLTIAATGELLARLMIAEPIESFDEALTHADSCLNALRLMKLDREIDELSSQVAEAERAGEAEKRDSLVDEATRIIKTARQLFAGGASE